MIQQRPNQGGDPQTKAEEMKSRGMGFARVWRALRYSTEGLISCLKHESAFRQEVLMAVVLIPLALWLPVEPLAKVWLIASVVFVLVAELINSALECVVDYISLELHPLAKRAKDTGSAVVLLMLLHMLFVWGYLIYTNYRQIFGVE
jgi:diacylglycerol kinase (ATP)